MELAQGPVYSRRVELHVLLLVYPLEPIWVFSSNGRGGQINTSPLPHDW